MNLRVVKVLILISLFIATYGFALLPILIRRAAGSAHNVARRKKIDRVISFLSCFAAGVFLGTCLLDLYPEVEAKLTEGVKLLISDDNKYKGYPFGEFVMVVGFFLVLIVEQIVLAMKESSASYDLVPVESPPPVARRRICRSTSKRMNYNSINGPSPDETDPLIEHSAEHEIIPRGRSASVASSRSINTISDVPALDDQEQSMHQDPNSHSMIRSLIMLAALSLHSVFEGLAVGLQDTVADVLSIFGALILHKCIIAFSIGLNLVQSNLSMKAIIGSNVIFCIASPVGIAMGILIEAYTKQSNSLINGILQGLACGTFLYVTFFEVLPHEFNKPKDRILKLLFVIIGFGFVNCILFLEMHLTYKG